RSNGAETWWSSAVNCNRLSSFAASRTLRRPLNALPQLCVWDAVVCSEFSLADRLPSAPSADDELPSLFEHFAGTTRSSDSLPTFMLGLWLIAFSSRPVHYFGHWQGLPVLARGVSKHAGVFDLAESDQCSRFRIGRCGLPH